MVMVIILLFKSQALNKCVERNNEKSIEYTKADTINTSERTIHIEFVMENNNYESFIEC